MAHIPVLLSEVVEGLKPKSGGTYIDCTVGYGGHSSALARQADKLTLIGFDLDRKALESAKTTIEKEGVTPILIPKRFDSLTEVCEERKISNVDGVLFDLGINSPQLDSSGRGFTFQKDEPLLMTLSDDRSGDTLTAEEILNSWDEHTLALIIKGFGQERFSGRIARQITLARKKVPIKTTFDLVRIIGKAIPEKFKHGRIHFATKTFQAIRIATNSELTTLESALPQAFEILKSKGRLAVITFHSLEDRIVKKFFIQQSKNGSATIITKKPITPGREELQVNPRARSAKLRILEKIL